MATRVFEGIKFFQEILKRTMAGTFLWNSIKIQWVVSEKKMFKDKRVPRWPWIAHLIFLDCSSQIFFVAFREEFIRISLCLYSARSLHSLIPCLLTDQNFKNNSEKGHARNISMRLFQNLTNSFWEDFSWFCLCLYSKVAPIHQSLVHGQIKISLYIFEGGHSRNISVNWELEATYSVVLID